MSAPGFTPISLYHSTTAAATPSAGNLAAGELAVNITDGKLFYKDNGGVVRVLATAAGSAGDVVGPGSSTDNALVRFDGTTGKLVQNSAGVLSDAGVLTGLTGLTSSGSITFSGLTSGRVTYAGTGGLLQDSANLTFDGTTLTANALTVSNAVTLSGGTANGVAFLNASKVLTTGSALTFDGTNLGVGASPTFFGGQVATAGSIAITGGSLLKLWNTGGTGVGGISSPGTDTLSFSVGSGFSEQMRLTSTGLGIGTSSPAYKLDVNGVTRLGAGSPAILAGVGGAFAGGQGELYTIGTNTMGIGTTGAAALRLYTNSALQATLDTSGNLGLGVTPSAWSGYGLPVLELPSGGTIVSAGTSQNLGANWYYSGGSFLYKTTAAATYFQQASGAFKWYTAPSGTAGNAISFTQAMTLDASGNLLVGRTSPLGYGERLSVNGVIATNGTQLNMLPGADYEFVQRSAFKMNFYVNGGSVLASLSITGVWTNASDARYKENITESQYGLAAVMALKPRAYNLIDQVDKPQIGFIAQEVLDVVPEVVESVYNSLIDEDRYTLSYGQLTAVLTKAIQEQQAIIESMKTRLASLESK